LHHDGQAGDNTWATSYLYDNSAEQIVHVSVSTDDPVANDRRVLPDVVLFTNIGPVVLDEPQYRITSTDKIVNAGDLLRFKFKLKNEDLTTTAVNILSLVVPLDTCASITSAADVHMETWTRENRTKAIPHSKSVQH